MINNGAPTFGLWYDFRQRLSFARKYEDFYARCPWIEEGERLGFAGVWPSERHFVDEGYLPSPLAHEQALESMRLFTSEVVSKVREVVGTA